MKFKNIYFIIVITALFVITPAFATGPIERYATWGFSTWNCGNEYYTIQLPKDSSLEGFTGNLEASPMPQMRNMTFIRESLTSLYDNYQNNSAIFTYPTSGDDTSRTTNSADQNLYEIDIKQRASNTISLPINVHYNQPISIPDGQINARIYTVTEDGSSYLTNNNGECLATELHLTLFYNTPN